jgi:CDP-paratose 2-epimerase
LKNPNCGEVYNIGGGRNSNCSLIEAVDIVENITGIKMKINFKETPRIGDHIWWISDTNKFVKDFPNWKINYTIEDIIKEIINGID